MISRFPLSTASGVAQQVRYLAVTGRHSKNVAAKKNKLDAARNKLYTRLGVRITMAAKAGVDPNSNVELARALKEAHTMKLPKENIDRAIKKASDHSAVAMEHALYEVFGHAGVGIIVTAMTDNTNRTVKEVKAAARKADLKMASSGSVLFQFDHKAMFAPTTPYDKDAVIEKALEMNLDDIDFAPNPEDSEHDHDCIVASVGDLGLLHDLAHELKIEGVTSLVYLPKEKVDVSDEDKEKNFAAMEEFENLEGIDAVFHNMS